MQLTLRSQMIAGVAAVGAAAMVVTPIAQPDLLPAMQRVSSAVALTAFDNPVSVLLATLDDTAANILDQAALPESADLFWPDSFYTPDFSFLFAPGYVGVIPDFANQVSFGGLSALASNLGGYAYAGVRGVTGLISGPATALFNTPVALVTAAGYLAAGRADLALAELQTQILAPLQQGIGTALAAVGYVLDNVIANATTVITSTIPGLVGNLISTVVGGTTYVVQSAIATVSAAVAQLLGGQFDAAWNTALNGLLGPDGTLGQLEKLTVGIGIVENVDYGPPDGIVPTVTIPSLRSDLTTAGQRLGDLSTYGDGGIRNDAFSPVMSVTPPAAALAATPAAAAAEPAAVEVAHPVAGDAPSDSASPETGSVSASVSASDTGSAAASDTESATGSAAGSDTASAAPASTGGSSADAPASPKAKASRGSARGGAK